MIVGICGSIGAGKDTVAKILVDGYGFQKVSWADKLKDIAADLFALTCIHDPDSRGGRLRYLHRDDCDDQEAKKRVLHTSDGAPMREANGNKVTLRRLLEYTGTEYGRTLYDQLWIEWGMTTARALLREGAAGVVIPDCRFPNEFAAVRDDLGVIWEVRMTDGPPTVRTGHVSDTLWEAEPKDCVLRNPFGNIGETKYAVEEALGKALET